MNKIKRKLFSMESILDSRVVGEALYYLIKWAGYPISQSTWERAEKVPIDSDLIEEYKMNVQMVGKCFYFDPLDQPPQIEDFVEVPPQKSELSTFNTKLASFQKQLNYLRDDVRQILELQRNVIKELKETKHNEWVDDVSSPKSVEEPQISKSEDRINIFSEQIDDGSFEIGDRVEKIGRAVQIKNKNIIMYYVFWKKRENGQTPRNSWVKGELVKEHEAELLCRYLWSKL